jgi:hypothetical protein
VPLLSAVLLLVLLVVVVQASKAYARRRLPDGSAEQGP